MFAVLQRKRINRLGMLVEKKNEMFRIKIFIFQKICDRL